MSYHRRAPGAGWVDPKKLPKGPNGRALCRYCGAETAPPRRTFCSEACVHEWKLRSNPGYVRKCLFTRDRGVCADCGLDTRRLKVELRCREFAARERRRKELGMPCFSRSWWDAAHILAVVQGGGGCGLANYKTLCVPCHKRDTARLRRELAEKARLDRLEDPEGISGLEDETPR